MIKKTNIDLSINPKRKNPLAVGVQLSSYDKNFHEFEIAFLEKELEESDTVNILTVFENSKRTSESTTEIKGGYALFSFDTSLIDREEVVTNYVYLKSGDSQAEIGAFKFDVKLSEIDNEARVIAKAYSESYETLIQDFEKEIRAYLPKLETMNQEEVIRQDEEEVRRLAEQQRQENEQGRESAESVRVSSEDERISNEQARELNEEERISKDSERDSKIDEIEGIVEDVSGKLDNKANKKQADWIFPTLLNGVEDTPTQPVRFMKDEFGFVHINGRVTNAVLRDSIFVLPQGYRPDFTASVVGTGGGGSHVLISIGRTTGNVSVLSGGLTYVTLDGISFYAGGD